MEPSLFITDQRMLEVMRYCIAGTVQGIRFKADWCRLVEFDRLNLPKVEKGKLSFQPKDILKCAQVFNVNINWLYGVETEMFRASPGQRKPAKTKAPQHSKDVNTIGNTLPANP